MKKIVVVLVLVLGILPAVVLAQTSTVSRLNGTVTDSAGAVVPGATVTITNVNTNASRTVQSDANGLYTFTNLTVGNYNLQVTKPGFQKYVQMGIDVHVSSNFTVNVTLPVGSVSQEVNVEASSAMVETQSTGVGQVINQQHIVDLPLNGRQPTELVGLSGAAVSLPTPPGGIVNTLDYPTVAAFSVAGGQSNATMYFLDGSPDMDMRTNVGLPLPFPDALQEFKVETSALPANYGSLPGGAVNAVTKSGTNSFHGDLFEFLRNGVFDARNYFASTRDSLKRNQFGGVIGGPVIKNKVFFFAGFQGTTERTAAATRVAHVPTQAVLNGNFQTILSSQCRSKPVTLSPTVATNNILNPGVENSVGMKFLSLLPVSADPCGLIHYGIPTADNEYQGVGRVDWQRTATDTLFFRSFISDYSLPPFYDKSNLLTSSSVGLSDRITSLDLGDTNTLSARAINTFRVSFARTSVHRLDAPGIPTMTDLGSNVTSPIKNYMGQIFATGYFTYSAIPGYDIENTYGVSENMALILGKHEMNFGGTWLHTQLNALGPFQMNPRMSFTGQLTGDALADIMTGKVDSVLQGNGQVGRDGQNSPSLYFQDFWKLTSRFQANLGVRWDPFIPQHAKYGFASDFSLPGFAAGQVSKVFPLAPPGLTFPGDAGFNDKSDFYPRYAEFAPRVGIVWDPRGSGKETIRAGYGIFYGSTYLWQTMHVPLNPPWGNTITLSAPAGGLSDPWSTYAGGNPFPTPTPTAQTPFPLAASYVFEPVHAHPTYVQQWNLALQKQIANNWMVSATYMGNKTTHQWLGRELNPAVYAPGATLGNTNKRRTLYLQNPTTGQYFGSVVTIDDSGNGSYNGLLLSVEHRMAHNFSVLGNYTWSHCLDDGSANQDISDTYQNPNDRRANWGNCDTDKRQIFNLSLLGQTPQLNGGFGSKLLANWQASAILTASTGQWLTVTDGSDVSLTGVGQDRPNVVANVNVSNPTIAQWFNTAAFAKQAPGTYGNAGRNTIQGPSNWNVNMALWRVFPIRENLHAEFRAEAFNAFNHTQFDPPTTVFSSPDFGKITSAEDPRIMQFAIKLTF